MGRNEDDLARPQVSNPLRSVELDLPVQDDNRLWLTRVGSEPTRPLRRLLPPGFSDHPYQPLR